MTGMKIILFLFGFGLSVIGFMYIIAYLNYLSIGYSFWEYLKYIFTHFECLLSLIGIVIICFVIFKKGDKNELYI